MDFLEKNYYGILRINNNATINDILKAKDDLKYGSNRVPFSEWALIDEAFSVLSDSERRKEYDGFLNINSISRDAEELKNDFEVSQPAYETKKFNLRDKKIKLEHDNKPLTITEIKIEELELFKNYNNNLSKSIDELLELPNNSHKLNMYKNRYANNIELLRKELEIRALRNINSTFDLFKNRLNMMSIVNELGISSKNFDSICERIENYNGKGLRR